MNPQQIESLTIATQAATLLASDIRSAHKSTCVENATAADNLLNVALLAEMQNAIAIQNRLKALLNAVQPSA